MCEVVTKGWSEGKMMRVTTEVADLGGFFMNCGLLHMERCQNL